MPPLDLFRLGRQDVAVEGSFGDATSLEALSKRSQQVKAIRGIPGKGVANGQKETNSRAIADDSTHRMSCGNGSNRELLFDQLGHRSAGPQFVGKAMVDEVVGQPARDDLLLGSRQSQRPAPKGPGHESLWSLAAKSRNPVTHTGRIDSQEVRRRLLRWLSVDHALNRQPSASLQFGRSPFGSHALTGKSVDIAHSAGAAERCRLKSGFCFAGFVGRTCCRLSDGVVSSRQRRSSATGR